MITIGCWKFSLIVAYAIAQLVVFTMGSLMKRAEIEVAMLDELLSEKREIVINSNLVFIVLLIYLFI